ncbi:hypothetical protein Syun_017284 [Stephania yunnanensis]|uniref:Uncharacterized protein n=1 Tax=Stephania yunnanensis TaxID=152371 RepID=A0AAP0J691_9MAGN
MSITRVYWLCSERITMYIYDGITSVIGVNDRSPLFLFLWKFRSNLAGNIFLLYEPELCPTS